MSAMTLPVILETERLRLRPHVLSDFDAVADLWSHQTVVDYIMPGPLARSEAWTRLLRYVGHWALLPFGYWVVEDKETSAFVGEVGFADWKREITPSVEGLPEIGWVLSPAAQGRGFAREAVRAALTWADRHIAADETVALINPDHHISLRLARDVGFTVSESTVMNERPVQILRRPLVSLL